MELQRTKKCIQALNRSVLRIQNQLYESIAAEDRSREEELWSVLDELTRRRLTLTHRYLYRRENGLAAERG